MHTYNAFIAYAPRGAGLRCAVAYISAERDVYGWFTGPSLGAGIDNCFFLLENFYTPLPTRYDAVDQADLHASWLLDEPRRHEVARMQEIFAREWLFHREEAGAADDLKAYADAELALGEVNVRFERLARFHKLQPNWTYYSQHFERPVLDELARHWPLEYRP